MTADQFSEWEQKIGLRRSFVLFTTLWMTWRAFTWAAEYASILISGGKVADSSWVAAAAMIAAVTAPITYLQAAVFKAYIEGK